MAIHRMNFCRSSSMVSSATNLNLSHISSRRSSSLIVWYNTAGDSGRDFRSKRPCESRFFRVQKTVENVDKSMKYFRKLDTFCSKIGQLCAEITHITETRSALRKDSYMTINCHGMAGSSWGCAFIFFRLQ